MACAAMADWLPISEWSCEETMLLAQQQTTKPQVIQTRYSTSHSYSTKKCTVHYTLKPPVLPLLEKEVNFEHILHSQVADIQLRSDGENCDWSVAWLANFLQSLAKKLIDQTIQKVLCNVGTASGMIGEVWCDIGIGIVWYGWYGMVWYDMVRCLWYGMVICLWYGKMFMVWYGKMFMVWYGMVW